MEVIRERLLYLVAAFALLLLGALQLISKISLGLDEKIAIDLGLGAIGLLSTLVAVFVGTGLLNKEIEKRTILILVPKPVSRPELIVGKHLGLWAVTSAMVALMGAAHFAILSLSNYSFPAGAMSLALVFLSLELALLVAAAMLFGSFTNSILAMLLSFGVYVMGHLSRDLLELGELSENPGIERATRWLYYILPDLERFNFRNDAAYGLLPTSPELLGSALYGGVYIILLLALAAAVFQRRQF